MKSRLSAEPALVGRDDEIQQLMQCLDSALSGRGTTVIVYGEAGVGKTRLANEFLNQAKRKKAKILSGWCLSEAAIPYFPFIEAFNTYMSTTGDEKERSTMKKQLGIAGWLKGPELVRESKALELFSTPEIARDRTFEAVAGVLLQSSALEPLILFLDDLQWADQLSLALFHYLARKCRNSRLLIIGTYRPEELARAREKRLHPLEETMFSMSREDLLIKIELSRLKREDFPEFLGSIFRASMGEKFVEKLYEETEGNPFFALETLNLLVEDGVISEKEGHWALVAPLEKIGMPSRVHEVITQRIARLEREERKVLDLAAVSGFSFRPDMLSRTLALDIADVLRTLVEIAQRHRLIRSSDSTFEFTHHKIREAIYADLPNELRKIYHLKTAGCLEQALAEKISDGYLADIALHYVEGGAPEKAFEYLLRLSEKAADIFANMQAIEYLDKALEATQRAPSLATGENLARIYKLRGKAWLGQGESRKAINDFNLLLPIAVNIGDESTIAEAHYLIGDALAYAGYGTFDEAKPHLVRAVEMARKTGNKLTEARSLASLGYVLFWDPDTLEEGRMRLEESSKICKETGDKVAGSRNHLRLATYHNWRGEFKPAKEYLNEGLALAEEMGDNLWRAWSLSVLGWVQAGGGEYDDAISTLQRCLQLTQEWGLAGYSTPIALTVLGWIYRDLSNIELALQYHNEALKVGKTVALTDLGTDYLCKYDYENAEKCFKEAQGLLSLHPMAQTRIGARIRLGLGEISLARGDCPQALKSADEALTASEKEGAKKYIAKGMKLKAEVLAKMDKMKEAIESMENALKFAQEVGNPPVLWQIHYGLGLLFEKSGNLLKANEHHAEAVALIEETASKLKDASLKDTLLTAHETKAIRDAYARTKPKTSCASCSS